MENQKWYLSYSEKYAGFHYSLHEETHLNIKAGWKDIYYGDERILKLFTLFMDFRFKKLPGLKRVIAEFDSFLKWIEWFDECGIIDLEKMRIPDWDKLEDFFEDLFKR